MPSVRLMRVNKYGFGEEDTDVSGVATAAAGLSVWFIRKSGKRKAQVRQRKQVLYANVIPAAGNKEVT